MQLPGGGFSLEGRAVGGDIEIEISPGGRAHNYTVRVVRAAAGGEPVGSLELDAAEILSTRDLLESTLLASAVSHRSVSAAEQPLREVGRRLFEALFTGPVYGTYRASLGAAQQRGKRLRVVLRLTAPELAALPWETLFDPETGTYLCRQEPLVRHVAAPYTPDPLEVRAPLRILGLVSAPRDLESLDTDAEKAHLSEALTGPISDGLVELSWVTATWNSIHAQLLDGEWHVLHFIGHSHYDSDNNEGTLAMVGGDGGAEWIAASRLADLLGEAQPAPRLVVLNSCSSGKTGGLDLFSGTAAALARSGIGAVAAMQFAISDTAAIAFARGFYTAIAHGRSVDEAARSGRISILGAPHSLEWVTPVLYLRGQTSQLFTMAKSPRDAPRLAAAYPQTDPGREADLEPRYAEVSADAVATGLSDLASAPTSGEPVTVAVNTPVLNGILHEQQTASYSQQLIGLTRLRKATARPKRTVKERAADPADDASRGETRQAPPRRAASPVRHWVSRRSSTIVIGGVSVGCAALLATSLIVLLPGAVRSPAPHPSPTASPPSSPSSSPSPLPSPSPTLLLDGKPPARPSETLQAPNNHGVNSVTFSPDGSTLAGTGYSTYRWRIDTGTYIDRLPDPESQGVNSAAFSPDDSTIAAADKNGSTYLWNVDTGHRTATLLDRNGQGVNAVAFSPHGDTLAAADDNDCTYLWDVATRKNTATFCDRTGQGVYSVAFGHDGTTLAAGDNSGSTYLWDVATGKVTKTFRAKKSLSVDGVAFGHNGATLAVGDENGSTYLWDVATGKHIATFRAKNSQGVWAVAFGDDGAVLAVGDANDSIYLWNVATGKLITTFQDPNSGGVDGLAFSPDGDTLAVADENGNAYLWNMEWLHSSASP